MEGFEYCVKKLIVKRFLECKHDRDQLADLVSTFEPLMEKCCLSYAEMTQYSGCHVSLQVITMSAEGCEGLLMT